MQPNWWELADVLHYGDSASEVRCVGSAGVSNKFASWTTSPPFSSVMSIRIGEPSFIFLVERGDVVFFVRFYVILAHVGENKCASDRGIIFFCSHTPNTTTPHHCVVHHTPPPRPQTSKLFGIRSRGRDASIEIGLDKNEGRDE
jgi:hypothetical protein